MNHELQFEDTTSVVKNVKKTCSEHSMRAATIEPVVVFWYDREPGRRVERAFENALPNFRKLRAEMP